MTHSTTIRSLALCLLFLGAAVAGRAEAMSTKPVKTVSESDLAEACKAIGGTFFPSRHEGDGYACDRPDGHTGVECHPGAGCEEFDTHGEWDVRPGRPRPTAPRSPTAASAAARPPSKGLPKAPAGRPLR